MKKRAINTVKLGIFVLASTLCLVLGLYYIGSKENIFSPTITVSADFKNVDGLLPGNNVRYNGINVGTVSKIYSISDTGIRVVFTINDESTKFISTSAVASISTDGLLGNKIIDMVPGGAGGKRVTEGSVFKTKDPLKMDNAMRTLSGTNDNLKIISDNLTAVSGKLNNSKALWYLLSDTSISENMRNAVVRFKLTGDNSAIITGDLTKIVQDIKAGKGSVGSLLIDSVFSNKLNQTIVKIESLGDSAALISGNFKNFSKQLKEGSGAIGMLMTDTAFVHNLNQSLQNIEAGTGNFNQNMEALKHSWPFKKYFKKKLKTQQKK